MKSLDYASGRFFKRLGDALRNDADEVRLAADVARILAAVADQGDRAVAEYTAKFDGADLAPGHFRLKESELGSALRSLTAEEKRALRESIACVKDYNRRNLPKRWSAPNPHGAVVGESFYPIRRVGIYVPGGRVPLLSSAVMTVTLAKIAGVPEIAVFTAPGPDGKVAAGTLAAIKLAGAKEVYRIGGVQAIGAMTYGTKCVPAVDKIFGPGNAFVVEAKRQVFGRVGIDLLPGPSEVMVIADGSCRASWVAADLLAQAEHGHGGKIFLVSTEASVIEEVRGEVRRRIRELKHRKVLEETMRDSFYAVRVENNDQAAEVANFVAPEHLELHVEKPWIERFRRSITTAGAVLEGEWTPAVLGDLTAGPSHELPTGRSGRFFSGLRVTDFMRRTSRVRYDEKSLKKALSTVEILSRLEDLDAHGRSATVRLDGGREAGTAR